MILVVGGYSQGKRIFVDKNLNCEGVILYDLNEVIKNDFNFMSTDIERETDSFSDKIISEYDVVITDEVGCGIVPVDNKQRELREITGRIQVKLATKAQAVYRVICGIGTRIK